MLKFRKLTTYFYRKNFLLIIMTNDFTGKAVIVTGSSSGIGRAAVLRFARAGADVLVHGQSEHRIKETLRLLSGHSGRVAVVRGPVEEEATQREIIDTAIAEFGRIDVLVNNAGTLKKSGADSESMENYDYILNVNLRSVIQLTVLALPHLQKTKGNIVNISSVVAGMVVPESTFYTLSKAALNHYTRTCAVKYASLGVRVNAVTPGMIATNILSCYDSADMPNKYASKEAQTFVSSCIPTSRIGTADECAAVIEFLAASAASYVTGSIFNVDGGMCSTNMFAKMSMAHQQTQQQQQNGQNGVNH